MEVSKSLRRPVNWQDFETLCKKLWGEIWSCQEIKKNGRSGQSQNGVDIFGIPKGETQFYGIQCKGKDEYSHKQFTEKEILKEIENAKQFKPKLKKLYFATTALKDANIETFIREKNIEHINNDLFEVHLFSWEDIVDLIDENRQTYNWYLKSQNFKIKKEAKITFDNDLLQVEKVVSFIKVDPKQQQKQFPSNSTSNSPLEYLDPALLNRTWNPDLNTFLNLSYFGFKIKILNTGSEPIEEYNIKLDFDGQLIDISETNQTGGLSFIKSRYSPILIDSINKAIRISPKSMLVGDDSFVSEEIFIKPKYDESKLTVKWKLLAKDFTDSGVLTILIKSNIVTVSTKELIDNPSLVGNKLGDMYDCLIRKSLIE